MSTSPTPTASGSPLSIIMERVAKRDHYLLHAVEKGDRKRSERWMRNGFTLLELTVVIAIIGLLFAFAVISFTNFGNKVSLRSAGDRVAATLRLAQQRAISEKETVVVKFTQKNLPANIKLLNPMTVKFASSGRPVPGYFGTIQLSDGKHAVKVVISPMGRIRIE